MHRIDPPLPVTTIKGEGLAHFVIDYGLEHDFQWVVFLNESGECWTFLNKDIRMQKNLTMHRNAVSLPET